MATARYCVLACLALGLLLPERASGAPAVAAAAVVGNVTGTGLINPGQRRLANGARLQENDQISPRTGLSLKMADGTVVKLAAPAQFQIETVRDPAGRARLRVDSGRAHGVPVSARSEVQDHAQRDAGRAWLQRWGGRDPRARLLVRRGPGSRDAAGERVVLRPGIVGWRWRRAGRARADERRHPRPQRGPEPGGFLRATPPTACPEGGEDDSDDVAAAHIAAAEALLRQAYDAYERGPPRLSDCLPPTSARKTGVRAATSPPAGVAATRLLNLDNARFFRQPGFKLLLP